MKLFEQWDARLGLGGLPAVSALFLAWPISVAIIIAFQSASYGESRFSHLLPWAWPWYSFPSFWPALVVLPFLAHIPTKLIPAITCLMALAANYRIWPLVFNSDLSNIRIRTHILEIGSLTIIPPIVYGFVITWLARQRDQFGSSNMRGYRPYRAAILALCVLTFLWFGLPLLYTYYVFKGLKGDLGGFAVAGAIIFGGLIRYFPMILCAVVAGIATISITHGIPRPHTAPTFLAVALAFGPLQTWMPAPNLLIGIHDTFRGFWYIMDDWREFDILVLGVTTYGLSLWLTRRRPTKSQIGLDCLYPAQFTEQTENGRF